MGQENVLHIAFSPVFHDFKKAFDTVNHTIFAR